MNLTYDLRNAIRYIAEGVRIELTDDEVALLIDEEGASIEAKGREIRAAAQAYEQLIIRLAAEMVARRSGANSGAAITTVREASMNESSQRRN